MPTSTPPSGRRAPSPPGFEETEDAIPQRAEENPSVRAARFAAVGFEFAGTVVAGVIAGYYLDKAVGTAPLFTLLLTLGGMGGALYRLLWSLKQSSSRADHGDRPDTD